MERAAFERGLVSGEGEDPAFFDEATDYEVTHLGLYEGGVSIGGRIINSLESLPHVFHREAAPRIQHPYFKAFRYQIHARPHHFQRKLIILQLHQTLDLLNE